MHEPNERQSSLSDNVSMFPNPLPFIRKFFAILFLYFCTLKDVAQKSPWRIDRGPGINGFIGTGWKRHFHKFRIFKKLLAFLNIIQKVEKEIISDNKI